MATGYVWGQQLPYDCTTLFATIKWAPVVVRENWSSVFLYTCILKRGVYRVALEFRMNASSSSAASLRVYGFIFSVGREGGGGLTNWQIKIPGAMLVFSLHVCAIKRQNPTPWCFLVAEAIQRLEWGIYIFIEIFYSYCLSVWTRCVLAMQCEKSDIHFGVCFYCFSFGRECVESVVPW